MRLYTRAHTHTHNKLEDKLVIVNNTQIKKVFNFIKKHDAIIIGIIIGVIAFLSIYGFSTLNVTYDGWIKDGYAEPDIPQHYAGWVNFRASEWKWPLGMSENLNYPTGTIISFTDSIPLVSIFFKMLNEVLPQTFQFFGIYVLLCFILQGIASAKLIKLITQNRIYIILGTILFVYSPIMIERAFRHTALASHWLILFSLYLYFTASRENFKKLKWHFLTLNICAITIHPYFLPMTMAIMVATLLKHFFTVKKEWLKILGFFVVNIVATLIVGYSIGALGQSNLSGNGYGYYNMNLNAVINPYSCGKLKWSTFLPVRKQILGNYDGFNYLGLGILISGILCILHFALFAKNRKATIKNIIKKHWTLIGILFCLVIFAISNVVTFEDKNILTISLPKKIVELCGIFRASSRMFYPMFYIIFLTNIVYIWKKIKFKEKDIVPILILGLIAMIQLVDIYPAISYKHKYFEIEKEKNNEFNLSGISWEKIEDEKIEMVYIIGGNDYKNLSIELGKMGVKSNLRVDNRIMKKYKDGKEIFKRLEQGGDIKNTIFLIADINILKNIADRLNENMDIIYKDKYSIVANRSIIDKLNNNK